MKKYIQIPKNILLFSLCFYLIIINTSVANSLVAPGDDDIYLANGNKLKGKVVRVEDDKIFFDVNKGGRKITHSLLRENVLFAFNDKGNYLIVSTLPSELSNAQLTIDDFNKSTMRESGYDLIIKAFPLAVIACRVSYESAEVLNYKLSSGEVGSINKADVVSVLYGDGRHQFIMNPSEAVMLMASSHEEVSKYNQKQDVPPPPAIENTSKSETVKVEEKTETIPANTTSEVKTETPLVTSSYAPTKTEQSTTTPEPTKPSLSDEEYQQYRTKAMQRVDEFGNYLNIITDKSLDGKEREKAIEQVVKMFLPNATIEVTSKDRPGSKKYKVRDYLTRMKLLPYSSAKVSWSEIQYVSELKQEADGNYYGTITGQQTFMGYGGTGGTDVLYSDVTQKNVKVKLQSYQKVVDGQNVNNWDVLLGNIGVAGK
jgi:hypothetical protein